MIHLEDHISTWGLISYHFNVNNVFVNLHKSLFLSNNIVFIVFFFEYFFEKCTWVNQFSPFRCLTKLENRKFHLSAIIFSTTSETQLSKCLLRYNKILLIIFIYIRFKLIFPQGLLRTIRQLLQLFLKHKEIVRMLKLVFKILQLRLTFKLQL